MGPTLDALASQTGSTTSTISLIFTANGVGFVAGSLYGARLFSRVNGTAALAATVLTMAALTATIPTLGALATQMLVWGLIGIGMGLVGVGTNTLVLWLYGHDATPYVNALHLSFGLGAFTSPLIIDRVAVASDDPANAYWLFALLMLPVGLRLLRVHGPDRPRHEAEAAPGAPMPAHPIFLVLAAGLFVMHVGGQLSFGGWIFSYAEEIGLGSATSARVLNSVFWGALVLGRLVAIPLSLRLSPQAMIYIDVAGAGAGLALIGLLPGSTAALWIGTAAFGASVASMYGSGVNFVGRHVRVTSGAMSALVLGAGLGSMTLPWLTGQFFDRSGPDAMLWVVGAAMAGAAATFAALQRQAARTGHTA